MRLGALWVTLVLLFPGCGDRETLDPLPPSGAPTGTVQPVPGRECSSNDDCRSAEQRFCARDLGECVECLEREDCDRGTCDSQTRTCVRFCRTPDDCGSSGLMCDTTREVCVECMGNLDCPRDNPICDIGNCVECLDDRDCHPGETHCNTERGRCRECLEDSHCTHGLRCESGRCETPMTGGNAQPG
jgi:Cys-rich repeat protein